MIEAPDETTLFTLPNAGEANPPDVALAYSMLDRQGSTLGGILDLGRLRTSVMQGSALTGGMVVSDAGSPVRVLLSREELSVSMTCKLMEDLSHE
jgi:hypothetical protein